MNGAEKNKINKKKENFVYKRYMLPCHSLVSGGIEAQDKEAI